MQHQHEEAVHILQGIGEACGNPKYSAGENITSVHVMNPVGQFMVHTEDNDKLKQKVSTFIWH